MIPDLKTFLGAIFVTPSEEHLERLNIVLLKGRTRTEYTLLSPEQEE